jgi:uncharacterized phage protein (TIGR01671 family)
MRDIEFRAKKIDTQEWIYGFIYEHKSPLQVIESDNLLNDLSNWSIINTGFADWNMPRPIEIHKVNPETIGQYVGQKDKNKTKIFEYDIVIIKDTDTEDFIGVITYMPDDNDDDIWYGSEFLAYNNDNLDCYRSLSYQDIEVVGNIFDNPESMKINNKEKFINKINGIINKNNLEIERLKEENILLKNKLKI